MCVVKPADAGRPPRWAGVARHLSYEVCQAMRRVLLEDDVDPCLSQRAQKVLAQLRVEHAFLRDGGEPFVNDSAEQITWYDFAGGAANQLLARLLEREARGPCRRAKHVAHVHG